METDLCPNPALSQRCRHLVRGGSAPGCLWKQVHTLL